MSDLYYDADLINYCDELEEQLAKYKRAFEILKDKLAIKTFINKGLYNENLYVVASIKDGGLITEEESKLLKELLDE